MFVTKINPAGSALLYCSFFGGSGQDYVSGIAIDGAGSSYVTGFTRSTDFPTVGAVQDSNHDGPTGSNAFVTKLNAAGSALVYSTYLGGSSNILVVVITPRELRWIVWAMLM